jgi:uncharacterized protein YcfJ
MSKFIPALAILMAASAAPAFADGSGFVAGAGTGAVAGAVVGGPVGAAVGAGVGGIVGGAATDSKQPNTVVIEQPAPRVIEDNTGSVRCSTTTVERRNIDGDHVTTERTDCP